jgi:quercetin dioxygenase-like cupin family protein
MTIPATSTVFIDNDTTCVTEWRFAPGAETGWHRHQYNYVVVPMMDGKLRIDAGDEQQVFAEMKSGEPYFREAGVEHNVINANEHEYAFMEIEFK